MVSWAIVLHRTLVSMVSTHVFRSFSGCIFTWLRVFLPSIFSFYRLAYVRLNLNHPFSKLKKILMKKAYGTTVSCNGKDCARSLNLTKVTFDRAYQKRWLRHVSDVCCQFQTHFVSSAVQCSSGCPSLSFSFWLSLSLFLLYASH